MLLVRLLDGSELGRPSHAGAGRSRLLPQSPGLGGQALVVFQATGKLAGSTASSATKAASTSSAAGPVRGRDERPGDRARHLSGRRGTRARPKRSGILLST